MDWKTTVDELFALFIGAGTALIPWMEKAQIAWKEPEAYDNWNDIVAELYRNVVCAWLYPDRHEFPVPEHGYSFDDYSQRDYIAVESTEYPGVSLAFKEFCSTETPFDTVIAVVLQPQGSCADAEWVWLAADGLRFSHVQWVEGNKEIRRDVHVLI